MAILIPSKIESPRAHEETNVSRSPRRVRNYRHFPRKNEKPSKIIMQTRFSLRLIASSVPRAALPPWKIRQRCTSREPRRQERDKRLRCLRNNGMGHSRHGQSRKSLRGESISVYANLVERFLACISRPVAIITRNRARRFSCAVVRTDFFFARGQKRAVSGKGSSDVDLWDYERSRIVRAMLILFLNSNGEYYSEGALRYSYWMLIANS